MLRGALVVLFLWLLARLLFPAPAPVPLVPQALPHGLDSHDCCLIPPNRGLYR